MNFPHSGDRIAQSDPQGDQETGLRHRRVVARYPIKTTRRTRPLTALAALGRELYELTASAANELKPFSKQRRRAASECRANPTVANILSRITAGQSPPVTDALRCACCQLEPPDGAASSMVSHLILESELEIKIEKSR